MGRKENYLSIAFLSGGAHPLLAGGRGAPGSPSNAMLVQRVATCSVTEGVLWRFNQFLTLRDSRW
jgi:hypothetical protein